MKRRLVEATFLGIVHFVRKIFVSLWSIIGNGITSSKRTMMEQMMNLDLKVA
jgi:hypothetical protein